MSLVIIDTGCANLSSVKFAFDRLGITAEVTDEVDRIAAADRLVLPGVGAAPFAMKSIESKGLVEILQSNKKPLLGICLGMQLLFETLDEGGTVTQGLGLIKGNVGPLETGELPSPHMGWNTLDLVRDDPLLKGIAPNAYAYFVHSFCADVSDVTLAKSAYGAEFSAIIRSGNIWGCQFHPERSSATGAQILKNFSEITL